MRLIELLEFNPDIAIHPTLPSGSHSGQVIGRFQLSRFKKRI